jgi:predicted nucleic acid-binding protein
MKPVFLDTVGMVAVWDRGDQWHIAAEKAYALLVAGQRDLVATTYVLAECGNTAARKTYRVDVADLRDTLESGNFLIVPTADDWTTAWEAYRRGDAAQAGIVDQLSFAVMRRLGITEAFTNDRHFAAAGFKLLF